MVAKLRRHDVAVKKNKQTRSKEFLFPACQHVPWFSGYDLNNFLYYLLLQMVGGTNGTGQWWPSNGSLQWKRCRLFYLGRMEREVINNDGGLCHACSCPHQTANNATMTSRWLTVFSDSRWKTMNAAFSQWGLKTVGSKARKKKILCCPL